MATQSVNGIIGRCVVQFSQLKDNGQPSPFFDESKMVHVSSKIESPLNGPKYATHVFQVATPSYINSDLIPLLSSAAPIAKFRLGIQLGGQTKWLPFERHIILNDTIQVLPDRNSGPRVSFRTADLLWYFGYTHIRTYKGPISDMASALWSVNAGGTALVEQCLTPGRGSTSDAAGVYYQSNESDLSFLTNKLTPRALSTSSRSGYRFFVLDDVFHFHTPGYGQNVAKVISYSGDAPMANDLHIDDRSVEYTQQGNTGVSVYSYDPVLGVSKSLDSAAGNIAIFSNSRGAFNGLYTMPAHIGQNLEVDERSKAQNVYATFRNETYKGDLTLSSNIDIRLGDIVDLQVSGGSGARSAYSGYWEVQNHVFSIDNGVLTTGLNLGRGEIYVKSGVSITDAATGTQATSALTPNITAATSTTGNAQVPSSTLGGGTTVQVIQAS